MQKYDTKWLFVGLLIALLNPILSGVVIGLAYVSEERLRREGYIVLGFTVIWAIVVIVFVRQYFAR